MTDDIRVFCQCGGEIDFIPIADVPPPPMALLQTAMDPPEEWRGWIWTCRSCGKENGVTYDWGTLDLGLVRDSVLEDTDNKFEVFE